jgi:hypothetical protein
MNVYNIYFIVQLNAEFSFGTLNFYIYLHLHTIYMNVATLAFSYYFDYDHSYLDLTDG